MVTEVANLGSAEETSKQRVLPCFSDSPYVQAVLIIGEGVVAGTGMYLLPSLSSVSCYTDGHVRLGSRGAGAMSVSVAFPVRGASNWE